jgi:hypothetical protein
VTLGFKSQAAKRLEDELHEAYKIFYTKKMKQIQKKEEFQQELEEYRRQQEQEQKKQKSSLFSLEWLWGRWSNTSQHKEESRKEESRKEESRKEESRKEESRKEESHTTTFKKHMTTLELDENATLVQIKKKYKQKALELHPDKVATRILGNLPGIKDYTQAEREFKELSTAYTEVLKIKENSQMGGSKQRKSRKMYKRRNISRRK